MAGQLKALAGIRDLRAVHLQDGHVAVQEVADVEVLSIRAEDRPFGKPSQHDLADLRHLFAVDLQHRHAAVAFVEPRGLGRVAAPHQHCHGNLTRGADNKALRPIPDHDMVDDARGGRLEVDDTYRVRLSVRGTRVAVVGGDGQLAVRGDGDVVRPEADIHVILLVGHLLPVHLQQRHLVPGELGRQSTLPVRGKGYGSHLFAHGHRVHQLHVLPLDGQYADGVVRPVGYQRQVAGPVDVEAGRLLAHFDGGDVAGWACREIDDVDLVVRHGLPPRPIRHVVDGVRHYGQPPIRRDGQVRRRAENGVGQRKVADDPRRFPLGDVHDGDRVFAGSCEHNLSGVVPCRFLVVADDHKLRAGSQGKDHKQHQDRNG